jgi:hypothetical protein
MEKVSVSMKQILSEIFPALSEFKAMKKRAKATYASVRCYEKLDQLLKSYDKARLIILEESCKKDEEGKPIFEEKTVNGRVDKNYVFDDATKLDIEKQISELAEVEHEIEMYGMEFSEIEDLKLDDFVLDVLLRFKIVLAPGEVIAKQSVLKPV